MALIAFRNLSVGPRPTRTQLREMVGQVTVVVTLQKSSEHSRELGCYIENLGLRWQWFPLDARPHVEPTPSNDWMAAAQEILNRLLRGEEIFVHCAAGIHRTSMVIYLVYRLHGWVPENAERAVYHHRPAAKGEVEQKLRYAESVFSEWMASR